MVAKHAVFLPAASEQLLLVLEGRPGDTFPTVV